MNIASRAYKADAREAQPHQRSTKRHLGAQQTLQTSEPSVRLNAPAQSKLRQDLEAVQWQHRSHHPTAESSLPTQRNPSITKLQYINQVGLFSGPENDTHYDLNCMICFNALNIKLYNIICDSLLFLGPDDLKKKMLCNVFLFSTPYDLK